MQQAHDIVIMTSNQCEGNVISLEHHFEVVCRVATVREKYLENEIFFQVREKSGNFVDGQGN